MMMMMIIQHKYKVLEVNPTAKCLPGISTEPVSIVTEEFITDCRLGTITIINIKNFF